MSKTWSRRQEPHDYDRLKPDATDMVRRLQAVGLKPAMLTGDSARTANAIAGAAGIEEVMARVLPGEKGEVIRRLQADGTRVAMVGDGINDAPALMQADVGIAIGAGADVSIESADIVLVRDRLAAVVDGYHIGRSSYRKTAQNLALTFSFNGIGVPLAATGSAHPGWAMIATILSISAVLPNPFPPRLVPGQQRVAPRVGMETLMLPAPSIHCVGCVQTLQRGLQQVTGVQDVTGDPTAKTITVICSPHQTYVVAIGRRISELGHVAADSLGHLPDACSRGCVFWLGSGLPQTFALLFIASG